MVNTVLLIAAAAVIEPCTECKKQACQHCDGCTGSDTCVLFFENTGKDMPGKSQDDDKNNDRHEKRYDRFEGDRRPLNLSEFLVNLLAVVLVDTAGTVLIILHLHHIMPLKCP